MNLSDKKRRWLQVALLSGFALAGICSLYESWEIYVLIRRAMILDGIAPHMGDAELPDEHQRALIMYPCALLAMGLAYAFCQTRPRGTNPPT